MKAERFITKQRPLDRASLLRQHAPVGAELERHDDAGHHPHAERYCEHFEPEVEHSPIEYVPRGQPRALDRRQPCRQPDRERREDDVKADDKRELEARQECWIELHGRCCPNSFTQYQNGVIVLPNIRMASTCILIGVHRNS
jgi:hypothetical protein